MGHRWAGYGHPALYNMINSGPGPAASDPQTSYWQGLSKELTEVDQTLNKKLTGLNATWEGAAAERAQTGLTPLAEWANDAQSASTVMKSSTELQANYVADARSNMPEPVPVTTPAPSGWDIAGAAASALTGNLGPAASVAAQAADHEAQEAAQNEAEQRAIQTMQSYESSSTWNRETLGTFVAPPDVVVSSPPPAAVAGSAVEGGGTFGGGVGGGSTSTSGFTPPSGGGSVPTVGTGGGGGGGGGGGAGGGGGGSYSPPPNNGTLPPQLTNPNNTAPPPTKPPVFYPPGGNPPNNPPPTGPGGNPPFNGAPPFGPNNPNGPAVPNGRLPVTGLPATPNAGDVARGAQPLRGMPGGLGGLGGLDPDGTRAGSQYGRPMGGGMPGESVVRTGPGGATAANAAAGRGGGVGGPMGAGGRRGDGEDDDEHYAADYLMETDDVWGDADLRVAPTVIGEPSPQQ